MSLISRITSTVNRSYRLLTSSLLQAPVSGKFFGIRFYSPQAGIDWTRIKLKERAMVVQKARKLPRIRKAALDRFRLTRFGWQHRRARLHSRERRNMRSYLKKRHRSIGFVHARDMKTMEKYFPHIRLRMRSTPIDTNVNLLAIRKIIGAHFG
jgi:hypothetical protein